MLFDWFTVGAQALNFLVLVWLMKRFLYKPILDAIDAREQRIALSLADAAEQHSQAQQERAQLKEKNAEFDRQRKALLEQAQMQALSERERLVDEARLVADKLRSKIQLALRCELDDLQHHLSQRSREEVFAMAKQVLHDLAGLSLEERMSEVFTERLRQLSEQERVSLAKALTPASGAVRVQSAFGLSAQQQAGMQTALNQALSGETQIVFEVKTDLISGIELSANGWKVAWNIADTLSALEQRVDELIHAQHEAQSVASNKPT